MPRQLTAKQEAFAAAVAKGSSMAEAYRTAYAVGSMSEDSIRAEGGKLAKNPRIALRIEQLRAPAIAKVEAEVAKTIDVNLTTWLFENARIGYSDIRQVLTPGGELLPPEEWPEDAAKTVKTYRVKTKTFTDKDGKQKTETIEETYPVWQPPQTYRSTCATRFVVSGGRVEDVTFDGEGCVAEEVNG